MSQNESAGDAKDSWDRHLQRALNSDSASPSSTWLVPDASATPLPEPAPGPALKPPADGSLMAESYKVMGEVGRGGIGIVLQARDLALGREVAVKILQPKHQSNIAAVTRFTREAKIAAQLQHPGIVPIYAAGQDNLDRPYIAMKLLRGSTLEELLRKRKDSRDGRPGHIRIFEQICQTMAYAHSRGVIHRDLKPGNVMVGTFGEVQIIDWGFARVLGTPASFEDTKELRAMEPAAATQESSALSVAGIPIGTPAYMAPEQAKGDLKAIDERTDVFCLGSVLAEILTGLPPHASASVREVLEEAERGDLKPVRDRLDRSGAEAELIAIAKDCLQPAKDDRPKNAAAVAERVSAFLSAAAERARRMEVSAERERSQAADERRKKRMVAVVAAFLVVIAAGVLAWFWSRAEQRHQVHHQVAVLLAQADGEAGRGKWDAAEEYAGKAEAVINANPAAEGRRPLVDERKKRFRERKEFQEALNGLATLRVQSNSPPHEMDRNYAEAFHKLGMDVDLLEPATIGKSIRDQGPVMAEQLILALDDWSLRFGPDERGGPPDGRPPQERREDRPPPGEPRRRPRGGPEGQAPSPPGRQKRVLEAANHADDHPWRKRLRTAIEDGDRKTLAELAASIEEKVPPASSIILLSHSMERGISVLQRAYRLYPQDFWISFFIADATLPTGPAPDARRVEICERHARLTVSLNPNNPHARALLASALLAKARMPGGRPEDRTEAIQELQAASKMEDRGFGDLVRKALDALDGKPGARDEARRILEDDPNAPPLIRSLLDNATR